LVPDLKAKSLRVRHVCAKWKRQLRLRVPYDRGEEGLRLHRISEAVSGGKYMAPASPTGSSVSTIRPLSVPSGGRLAVSEVRRALSDFYDIAVRIPNIAARLAILFFRFRDELGSSLSP
jgi:hypothetical protein